MPTTTTSAKRTKHDTYILSSRDDDILAALATYHYLTAEKVLRLFYAPGSLARVQTRLKALFDAGYVDRRSFRHDPVHPLSWQHLYWLTTKGVRHLQSMGHEFDGRLRLAERQSVTDFHTHHELACIEVAIGARLLGQRHPTLQLARWLPERQLRQTPAKVTIALAPDDHPKPMTLVPDGLLEFHSTAGEQVARLPILLETDCDTESQRRWKQKIRAYLAWTARPMPDQPSGYETAHGLTRFTLAVLVAPRHTDRAESRCLDLLDWTETELTAQHRLQDAASFRFTYLPATTDPVKWFTEACWYQPFDDGAHPLLTGLDPATSG